MPALVYIKKENNLVNTNNYGGFEKRNESTVKLISQSLKLVNKNVEFYVFTDDRPYEQKINNINVFSYSTTSDDYSNVCPDFLFDCWREVGIDDYNKECLIIKDAGKKQYKNNKIGWIGSGTDHIIARKNLLNISINNKEFLEVITTNFTKDSEGKVGCENFLTREQQIERWKYLIDVEGCGWSARLKLLLWSGRPVFIVNRAYKEFFYQFLKPWVHYIPVKEDFSDLIQNYNIIESNQDLYNYISKESLIFCEKYLTREAAIKHWADIINEKFI